MHTTVTLTPEIERGIDPARGGLRDLIRTNQGLSFLMEAHDGLSAAIAQRGGFKGLWASGLSISSSLGYRDANEASWTELVDVVERMVDATGHSSSGGCGQWLWQLQQRAACRPQTSSARREGICLEDKGFPKMNSFVGDRHPLAEIKEFCGRLQAVKDTVSATDFVLVARIEALIAGHGQDEALARAHAYADAGADAILIHSRKSEADEIFAFTRSWQNRLPVVIVPTKYYRTPVSKYREAGISTVIWANHNMRAAIAAMRDVCTRILNDDGIAGIESEVATLEELFELMAYDELAKAEERYLPQGP